jgi:NitT/TauT family transport system ATP-binding protein
MKFYVKNLSKSYGELKVLDNISIDFAEGKVTCILGPSGCGKTTLLNILTGASSFQEGEIGGFAGNSISYIFQEDRLIEWKTVKQNLEFVIKANKTKEERDAIIDKYLSLTDMLEYKDYYPNKLSGGMRQRVSIIRAFSYSSNLLIMDEPFKSLDSETKGNVMKAFVDLKKAENMTVIFVTHDLEEANLLADRIITLSLKPTSIISDVRKND